MGDLKTISSLLLAPPGDIRPTPSARLDPPGYVLLFCPAVEFLRRFGDPGLYGDVFPCPSSVHIGLFPLFGTAGAGGGLL